MLRISFRDNSDQRLVEALRTKGPAIVRVLMGKVNELMIMLQSYIVGQKLSGQVLRRQSGHLAGSVRYVPAVFQGTTILGEVEAGSGPAGMYAGVHEYGGSHAYTIMAVNARALAFVAASGDKVFVRPPRMVIHPPAIQRSFMASSMDDNADDIRARLEWALQQEVNR